MSPTFWIENGKLAEQIRFFVEQSKNDKPHIRIEKIKEFASELDQEISGEPTIARAVVEIIDKLKSDHETKIRFILNFTQITCRLRDMEISCFN
ncbi:MAG: hypothetical protein ACE5HS_11960 [bacterium]